MQEVLQQQYWNNAIQQYIIAMGIFLLSIIIVLILKRVFLKRLRKWAGNTASNIDDFVVRRAERSLVPLLYIIAFYIGISTLNLTPKAARATHIVVSLFSTFFVLQVLTATLRFLLQRYLSRRENGEEKAKQINGIMLIISAVMWMLGIVFLLDNWGFNVTAIITGLGIGGIAIALAAQTILGDLFSYFVIFFDRPFEIGDFIVIQDKAGVVEFIGIKTTRLRSLSGEQLVFSNTDLTNSRVHNYKRMERRRIVFKFGVVYQTPKEKLEQIPVIVKNIINANRDLQFDRAHFLSFDSSQLTYEVVYFVLTGDYNKYMDNQQAINLSLFDAFRQAGIAFALPTQTLFIRNNNGNGAAMAS